MIRIKQPHPLPAPGLAVLCCDERVDDEGVGADPLLGGEGSGTVPMPLHFQQPYFREGSRPVPLQTGQRAIPVSSTRLMQ